MNKETLALWITMMRFQFEATEDPHFFTPQRIQSALVCEGLIEECGKEGEQTVVEITQKGKMTADLTGPDLGIATNPRK